MTGVRLRALRGSHVEPDLAARVVAPPYDAVTEAQRAALALEPDSYLGALPPHGTVSDPEAALASCRARVDSLRAAGRYREVGGPFLAVLRLTDRHHRATGVVGDLPAAAFLDGRVLLHEHVRVARVRQLADYLDAVRIASSPVALLHPTSRPVATLLEELTALPPTVGFTAQDDVEVALWVVTDVRHRERLVDAVDATGTLTVADGHHRAAAVAHARGASGEVLVCAFGADQLRVEPFHRRVAGLDDPGAALAEALELRGLRTGSRLPGPRAPALPGTVTVTADGAWWPLDLRERRRGGVVDRLDASTVEREVLAPLRLVSDDGARVIPVAAPLGLTALVDASSVGVALHPPSIGEILAVAAAGEVLPPKSTYLTPKLRSGLLLIDR